MLEGSNARDRITASPRKMWVPGVHAYATAGARISASTTAIPTRHAETARGDARTIDGDLDPDALTLPTDRFAQIVQLVLHDVVDGAAGAVDVVAHLLDHVVDRNAIDEILAALDRRLETAPRARCRPARAFHRALSCPSRALEAAITCPSRAPHSSHSGQRRAATGVAKQRTDRSTARRSTPQQKGDTHAHRRP